MRWPVVLVVLALLSPPATAAVEPAPAPVRVEYADDRLTVQAEQVEIAEVLAAVARATGAEVRGSPLGPRRVTADFEHVPVTAALERLLGEQNFTLRYGEGGRLRAVVLRGGPETPVAPPPPPPVAAAAPAESPPPTTIGLPRRFSEHRPVLLPAPLQKVVGAETATFERIFDLATTPEDGVTRALAQQLALSTMERERMLRRALFTSIRRGQEGTLGAFLQTPRAIEMLEYMAAHSREPGLKKKATVLLDQVRPPPPEPPAGG